MASFDVAFDFVMRNEDGPPPFRYQTVNDNVGQVLSGINSNAFPAAFAQINALTIPERPAAVEQFYRTHFWNQWYEQLTSDEVAKRVFDAAVNMGPGTAVRLIQTACNMVYDKPDTQLQVDGGWGPATVARINLLSDSRDDLVDLFKEARVDHYQAIVAKNPANQRYLAGWTARASK